MAEPTISLTTITVAVITGVIGKALYDYFRTGRVEQSAIYKTKDGCQESRDHCDLPKLKDEMISVHSELDTFKAETNIRLAEIDKKFDENSLNIRTFQKDITEIKEGLSRNNTLLETLIKNSVE